MPSQNKIIVDTSAFYALIASNDIFHTQARTYYERLLDWEWELWTTSYVLVETSALVYKRLGYEPLKILMDTILSDAISIIWIENTIHDESWKRMMQKQGKILSLVDWTTAVVAERMKASVFAFDQGFIKEGVFLYPRIAR